MNSEKNKVALIDTAGTLSLGRLRDILVLRLHRKAVYELGHQQPDSNYAKATETPNSTYDGIIEVANLLLNRVNYMRVFDLAGVVEAVNEAQTSWEIQAQSREKAKGKDRGVIKDSEDEDEDEDNSPEPQSQKREERPAATEGRASAESCPADMIVIDTIANVVTSILSKSQVQGNSILPYSSMSRPSITHDRWVTATCY